MNTLDAVLSFPPELIVNIGEILIRVINHSQSHCEITTTTITTKDTWYIIIILEESDAMNWANVKCVIMPIECIEHAFGFDLIQIGKSTFEPLEIW